PADVGDMQPDRAVIVPFELRANLECRGACTESALEMAEEAVRAVNGQVVLRGHVPCATEPLSRLDCIHAHSIRRATRAHLKYGGGFPGVQKIQLEGIGRARAPVHVQLVREGSGGADASLLLRYPERQLILSRNERADVSTGELVHGGQEGVGGG